MIFRYGKEYFYFFYSLFLFVFFHKEFKDCFDKFRRIYANYFVHTSPRFLHGMNQTALMLQRKNEPQKIRF